ncbi:MULTISPECIES: hypothetical protein [unclassified Streptomyces]|uniref:hypothetical protein n=1 Tax=unclassified Streptomyces TaxID=2593676 RepID=UPI0036642043
MANPQAESCEQLMLFAKDMITSTTTPGELEELLLGVLQQPEFEALSPAFVKDNIEEIHNLLGIEAEPTLICAALGVCG